MENTKETIKSIYKDLEETAKLNEHMYLMPLELYNQIFKKLGYLDDELRRTKKRNQELRNKIREMKK